MNVCPKRMEEQIAMLVLNYFRRNKDYTEIIVEQIGMLVLILF